MDLKIQAAWWGYMIPACFLLVAVTFLVIVANGILIGLALLVLAIIYFLYILNMRLEINNEEVIYGLFMRKEILRSEIVKVQRGTASFRGSGAPTYIIKSKDNEIKIPTKSFRREDLKELYSALGEV